MLKRRLNVRSLGMLLLAIVAVCITTFSAFRTEAWTVNPADYRYDMTLYFSLASKEYENTDLYEYGAFINEECRGVAEKLDLPGGKSCLYMRIRSNSYSGEMVEFKMRDKQTGQIAVLKNQRDPNFWFQSDKMVGEPMYPFIMERYFDVSINTEGQGTVQVENGLYPAGTEISVTAVPVTGYHFEGWSDGVTEPSRTFILDANINLTAFFAVNIYKAVFNIDGEKVAELDIAYDSPVVAPEIPSKEGYTFSGWDNLPERMPASDIEVNGSYTINVYKATFKIDDEIIAEQYVEYNAPVVAPEAPVREGHTFTGWRNVPETMPPFDIEILGAYDVQAYTATFIIDGEVIATKSFDSGASVVAPEAPVREGHNFSGWQNLPEIMPPYDIEVTGSYIVNTYKATFIADGEVVATLDVEYNKPVVAPEAPAKEGYAFTGWQNVPETMPPFDIEILGTYDVQSYLATFILDGEIIATLPFDYGTPIVAPEVPVKEGHSFSGWQNLPETMPAEFIEVTGSYIVNTYKAIFKIDNEVVATLDVEYNQPVVAPEAPAKEGHLFTGWQNVPETMPPFDVEIVGTYDVQAYTATFKIDGEVIASVPFDFGAPVVAPEAPAKEGLTFSGWENLPETMPAQDIEINGSYRVTTYKATFSIDGEVIAVLEVEYNKPVVAPEAPAKEGYIFTGWQNVPETMPPFDVEIVGTYDVQAYTATFKIDGEVIASVPFDFGATVVAPEAPVREGHTFAGWQNMPETMPAQDVEINGTYTVNTYKAIFKIDGDVVATLDVEYNKPVVAPEAPAKAGYVFTGWQNVPETMPPFDVEIVGTYDVQAYTATFKIDGEVIASVPFDFGTAIVAPEAPVREGHTFAGWQNMPETMPAEDIEINGTYEVNTYKAIFKIDGDVVATLDVEYNKPVVAPEAPAKAGYVFTGWQNVPETMPPFDVEIVGTYDVQAYTATFKIDGEVIASVPFDFGTAIVAPEAPVREGHTFAGWQNMPETMPAEDIEINGTYEVNTYKAIFKIDGEVIATVEVPYNQAVTAPEAPAKEGHVFTGWQNVPETMPPFDVEIVGTYDVQAYTVTFKIDDEVVATLSVDFGSPIPAPAAPAKEYYVFNGWENLPETMPAQDIVVTGSYSEDPDNPAPVPTYMATFIIGDETIASFPVEVGAAVVVPEAPVKEGHTFAGWTGVPETMPAQDIEINGSYTVNIYKAIFKIDGEVIATVEVPYNQAVTAPEAPAKEGHVFTGWQNIPETMPPFDIEILGTYDVQAYNAVFKIDGEVIATVPFDYGTAVVAPEAPVKEGHTFAGWTGVPETMPAQDIEINGSYTVNIYKAIFKIDGEVIATVEVPYNQAVTAPEAPAKEGHVFTGWQNIPETMPPFDIEIVGTYDVQAYNAVFKIDGEVIATVPFDFGTAVVAPEAPVKEGHTFAGWTGVPETMPAQDIEINGSYTVNIYKAIFKIDGEVIATVEVPYNQAVTAPEAPAKEGYVFTGWQNIPETMPPFDIEILGTYDVQAYTATFKIDGEVIATVPFDFGTAVVAPEAPVKEGHTFAGWIGVPETMPAQDIEINGSYTVNIYKAIFKIDGEVIATVEVPYNQTVTAPEAPAKEGHVFTGWQNIPETMPPFDIEILGTYDVQAYTATFKINGEVVATVPFDFGTAVVAPEAPVKEGHTFAGWTGVPETMPAQDIEINGSYTVNIYKAIFKIDGEVIATVEVPYNQAVTAPEAPAKEGHVFTGWQNIPETMPPFDIEIVGTYDVQAYTVTFTLDGDYFTSMLVDFGSAVVTPEVPVLEGHTFAGWTGVPETMPAQDIEIDGSYTVNIYKAIFSIDGEVIATVEVPYNQAVTAPEAPAKEGYVFTGWQNIPETMPPFDIEIVGTYDVQAYNAVFMIDGEVVATIPFDYGTAVVAPEAPVKEGHTFAGWTGVPETMPAHDVEINGSYTVNNYKAIFSIDGEVIATVEVPYNQAVTAPEAPAKVGHTFTGWQNLPEAMPPFDIEIVGTYALNAYTATFMVDGQVVGTVAVDYGSSIVAPDAPVKIGHTFTGWINLPETMPAEDIVITGEYTVNKYLLTIYLNGELYSEEEIEYGAPVVVADPELPEGKVFEGWISDIPATMPANNVEIYGIVSDIQTALKDIVADGENVTISNLNGVVLYKDVKASDIKERLVPGIYIVNGRKVLVK